jgi:hypothetical protein
MKKYESLQRRQQKQTSPKQTSAKQIFEMVHDLSNALAALKLRVDILRKDRACTAVQGDNLAAIDRIAVEAGAAARKLEKVVAETGAPRPRSTSLRTRSV